MSVQIHETPTPTEADARQARESLQQISHFLTSGTSDLSIRIQNDEQSARRSSCLRPPFDCSRISWRKWLKATG